MNKLLTKILLGFAVASGAVSVLLALTHPSMTSPATAGAALGLVSITPLVVVASCAAVHSLSVLWTPSSCNVLRIDLGRYLDDVLTGLPAARADAPGPNSTSAACFSTADARAASHAMAQRLQPHRLHSARLRAGVAAVPQPKPLGRAAPSATSWHATWAAPWATRVC